MNNGRRIWLAVLFMLVAAVFQGRVAHAIHIRAAQPDFVLIVLTCSAILLGDTPGIVLGVWGGFLTAIMLPSYFGSYLASRTIAGAFAGTLQRFMIRDSLLVPSLAVMATTFIAQIIFLLMVPHHPRIQVHFDSGELLYNAVLAFPIYFGLRKVLAGKESEDSL
jgi:rod shape-determining protein MreD